MSAPTRWLAIVGIGEDGLDGLSPGARRLIAQAGLVVGGARHLTLAGRSGEATLAWPSPIEAAMPAILARRGTPVCVLASGDPFCFGVGALLLRHVPIEETLCLPAPSAFSLAAARLGWSLQDCATLSLHGRPLEAIIPHLQPGARLLALSWDGATPARLAALLASRGMGGSKLIVCEAMGGPRERLRESRAEGFCVADIAALNTIALEVVAAPGARVVPRAAGLPDAWFEHDGQLTKRAIRAMTLAALAPRRGETLWDVGAGSGSVAIEWMLADPANRAIAIERDAARAARIARNAAALGVPGLVVVAGEAPRALDDLPRPDAVFVGGGTSDGALLDAVLAALAPGGRLVVNAVTLEGQAELVARQARFGGELTQIQIAGADPVGRFRGWRPAMPVVQWAAEKPWPA
jgi:precorrin-6Y C5,15-methyltransferase (decarboxylating)